jgi:hypothetical protein
MLKWSMYNERRRPHPVDVEVLYDITLSQSIYYIPYDGLISGAINTSADERIEEYISGSWIHTGDANNFQVYLARANQTRLHYYSGTNVYGLIMFRGVIDGKVRGFRIIRKIYEGTIAGYGTQVIDTDGLFMIIAVCPYGLAIDYYSQTYSAWWTSFTLNSGYGGYVAVGYALGKANRVRLRSTSNVSVTAKVYLLGWI